MTAIVAPVREEVEECFVCHETKLVTDGDVREDAMGDVFVCGECLQNEETP